LIRARHPSSIPQGYLPKIQHYTNLGLQAIQQFLPLAKLQATKIAWKIEQLNHKASKVTSSYMFDVAEGIA